MVCFGSLKASVSTVMIKLLFGSPGSTNILSGWVEISFIYQGIVTFIFRKIQTSGTAMTGSTLVKYLFLDAVILYKVYIHIR